MALHLPYTAESELTCDASLQSSTSYISSTSTMRRRSGNRLKFNPRILCCPFKCGQFCKSASGLTQHRNSCSLNPANRRAWTPPSPMVPNAPQTPPTTPMRFPSPGLGFHTPLAHQPRAPTTSPHRFQWTVNRRGTKTRIHPILNGESFLVF